MYTRISRSGGRSYLQIVEGYRSDTGAVRQRVVANLGWHDVRLPAPVHAGDTIEAESTIVDKRASKSRPDEGILTVDTRAYNQRRELVLAYEEDSKRQAEEQAGYVG